MKVLKEFRKYHQLLARISIAAAIYFSTMAGFQISYAQELFELSKSCISLKDECLSSEIERIDLLTLMWDETLRIKLLLCCLFYFVAGVFWFKKEPSNDN